MRSEAAPVGPRWLLPQWQPRRSDAIFVATLALVCGLSAYIGVVAPLGSFAHDTFFFLDNSYRVLQGQVPHRDFSSAWGPIIYLINAAGLALSGLRPAGIGYANALFGTVIAIWAFLIVRPRWHSSSACAVGIYTVLLIVAPFPLSSHPLDFGYAMVYNRYGYAIIGIIMMECAANVRLLNVSIRQSENGAISTGIALGLLTFLKISYAIVAIPLIALSIIFAGDGRLRRLIALCGGVGILAFIILCYLRFDFTDMFQDLAIAATARQMSLHPLRPIGIVDLVQTVPILIFAALILRTNTKVIRYRAARCLWALFTVFTVAAGYLLLISNQQRSTFPLNGYAAVALVAAYGRITTVKRPRLPGFSPDFPMALLLAVSFIPICIQSGMSLVGASLARQWVQVKNVTSLASTERGADLLFRPVFGSRKTETAGVEYVEAVNDGLDLLRRNSGPHDGILAFDEFNPFNYLLNRPSPRGGFAAAAYNYIFCDAAHPTEQRLFGGALYVMVRKYKEPTDSSERNDVRGLMKIYGAALLSSFSVIEETEHWVLWRHKIE